MKIALDSRKLNEACVKRKAAMPIMQELISKRLAEITKNNGDVWMSKIDSDNAYGQAKLSKEAAKHSVFSIIGGDFTGHYGFKKGFDGLRISQPYSKSISSKCWNLTVWQDNIICVTNGTIDEHEQEVRELLNQLQNAGYRASEKKTELFKQELTWLDYHINQSRVKPIEDKTEAITKLSFFPPKNAKELKSFLVSIQHLSKFINNLSKKTDRMRKSLKKETRWEWAPEIDEDFENRKTEITE